MAFFKIIISNYNNKQYIHKCINSILKQKFQDFNLIIVDDISTDGSDLICRQFAKRYPDKIQFIQLTEKGYAGKCRNTGLDVDVNSKYTYIMDGDDWMHNENTLQNIYNIAIKHHPDLIRCSYDEYRGPNQIKLIKLKNNFKYIINEGAAPWKNCFNSKFDYIRFIENRSKCNDIVWFLRLCDVIDEKKIVSVPYPCCIYNIISSTSCQHSNTVRKKKHCIHSEIYVIKDIQSESFQKELVQKRAFNIILKVQQKFKNWEKILKTSIL